MKTINILFLLLFLCSFLPADFTTTINLGAEIGLSPKTMLDLYANYNLWSLGTQNNMQRIILPEGGYK